MESPIPQDIINWKDILAGVGELLVDEAKLVLSVLFYRHRDGTKP